MHYNKYLEIISHPICLWRRLYDSLFTDVETDFQKGQAMTTLEAQVCPIAKPMFFLPKRMLGWAVNPCQVCIILTYL